MYRKTLLLMLVFLQAFVSAQTYDFDLTKTQPVYNENDGYGYDILPAPDQRKSTADPF